MSDEWIEHTSGALPDLPKGARVECRFEDGWQDDPVEWEFWLPKDGDEDRTDYWRDGSIIAYRVVSE